MPRHTHCTDHAHSTDDEGRTSDAPAGSEGDGITRRRVLHGAGAVAVAGLAGCIGGDGGGDGDDAPAAITVPDGATCDVCGMVIVQHPGPTSLIFYEDEQPAGHDNPARFDSTWEAFQFDFERSGWSRQAFYVTDYSAVDYEIRSDDGQQLISRHAAAGDFADANDVTFVVGSEVLGTMGRDLIAFSEESDAESFADEYGGDLGTIDDVTPELISSLGM
ncbi:nitrous oxide reduction lipoprotein [Salinarchaeum sp. Harcht-Bsk1]|nr:nitrous oxide reduction lipoprotein [Salinarchaeum sp. Harcht-Bsk1]